MCWCIGVFCVSVSVYHVCVMCLKSRGGDQIPQDWSDRWQLRAVMWVLVIEPTSPGRAASDTNCWTMSKAPWLYFIDSQFIKGLHIYNRLRFLESFILVSHCLFSFSETDLLFAHSDLEFTRLSLMNTETITGCRWATIL